MLTFETYETPAPLRSVVCFVWHERMPEVGDAVILETYEHGPWAGEVDAVRDVGLGEWLKVVVLCREPLVN